MGILTGEIRGGNHSAGRCGISKKAGREASGARAAKNSESSKGE